MIPDRKRHPEFTPLQDALALRAGCRATSDYHPAAEVFAEDLRNFKALAEQAGYQGNINALLSSGTLDNILDGFVRRVAADTGAVDDEHRLLAQPQNLPNFKPASLVRLLGGELKERPAGAEAAHVDTAMRAEDIKLVNYAGVTSVTRRAVHDAEWDLIAAQVRELAAAAIRAERTALIDAITANAALSDGIAQFHTDRANIVTGAFTSVTLGEGFEKLKKVAGNGGSLLQLKPRVLLSEVQSEFALRELLTSAGLNQLTVISDSRVSGAYLLPDPRQNPAFALAHLDGQTTPVVTTQRSPRDDTWKIKALFDCAAAAVSARAVRIDFS